MSIHKDILRKIYKKYLDKNDRFLLLFSVGIKMQIPHNFIISCIHKGEIDIVKWGFHNGCNCNKEALISAITNRQPEILKWLINCKVKGFYREVDYMTSSPLWTIAVENNQVESLKILKENGYVFNINYLPYPFEYMFDEKYQKEILEWFQKNV